MAKTIYEHYIKLRGGRDFVFLLSNTVGGVFYSDITDPEDDTMFVVEVGESEEELEYLDTHYYKHPEDNAFFLIPREDVITMGARPRTKK